MNANIIHAGLDVDDTRYENKYKNHPFSRITTVTFPRDIVIHPTLSRNPFCILSSFGKEHACQSLFQGLPANSVGWRNTERSTVERYSTN